MRDDQVIRFVAENDRACAVDYLAGRSESKRAAEAAPTGQAASGMSASGSGAGSVSTSGAGSAATFACALTVQTPPRPV
jgi:hypothetical protein